MNPLQIIIDFFKETFNRIKTKSPYFFKILMVLGASLTFAGYFPSMLQQWFNVEVSGGMIHFCESVAKYAAGFFVSSSLTAKADIVGQTERGNEVKVTDETRMPFTARKEQVEVLKTKPPPETLEQVPDPPLEKIDTSKFPYEPTPPPGK